MWDQPWLGATSTTTVIEGMNLLETLVECVRLELPGQEVLLHVKGVSTSRYLNLLSSPSCMIFQCGLISSNPVIGFYNNLNIYIGVKLMKSK